MDSPVTAAFFRFFTRIPILIKTGLVAFLIIQVVSQEQRYQIEILKKAGKNQKEIAELLEVSASTISRELDRNKGKRGYRPKQAQIKADKRRAQAAKTLKMTEDVILLIEAKNRAGLES